MPGLSRELLRSLAGTGVVPRLVAEAPRPEWRIGVLTVVVGARTAELRYARERVGSAKPAADDIVTAARRAWLRLQERSLAPDALLPRLAAAYASVLARHDGRAGDRVPLVEVRDELALTRAQFAWDVARLVRDRRLVVDGRRIDLGTATGPRLARARSVWLENDGGGGAFFTTVRLIPEARHDQTTPTPRRPRPQARAAHAGANGGKRKTTRARNLARQRGKRVVPAGHRRRVRR
jgi:hypothetical protein